LCCNWVVYVDGGSVLGLRVELKHGLDPRVCYVK
jgi:hypothetical protein